MINLNMNKIQDFYISEGYFLARNVLCDEDLEDIEKRSRHRRETKRHRRAQLFWESVRFEGRERV